MVVIQQHIPTTCAMFWQYNLFGCATEEHVPCLGHHTKAFFGNSKSLCHALATISKPFLAIPNPCAKLAIFGNYISVFFWQSHANSGMCIFFGKTWHAAACCILWQAMMWFHNHCTNFHLACCYQPPAQVKSDQPTSAPQTQGRSHGQYVQASCKP